MPQLQPFWHFIRRHRFVSILVGHVVIITILAVIVLNSVFGLHLFSAFANQVPCASGDQTYNVAPGDTLGTIATTYHTTWQSLASHNQISNPNLIYVQQRLCIPVAASISVAAQSPLHNTSNLFPYGQCTWWANQRYFALHGYFVPWTTNSDAWQWTARAIDFNWNVSSQPSIGAIINLQPNVQGVSSLGHVAIVEQILDNGHIIASSMNVLGAPFGSVVNLDYQPGPGVTFITI